MRILVDMDGVIVDCLSHWIKLINRYHFTDVKIEDITHWDLEKFCAPATREQVYSFLTHPGFFRHLDPIPSAIESIKYLIDKNHDVVIVTACKHGFKDKLDWIKDHMPWFDLKNIIFAERKELVYGDVLIDDGVHNLEAWEKETNRYPICFATPYNKNFAGRRADNWKHTINHIETCQTLLGLSNSLNSALVKSC